MTRAERIMALLQEIHAESGEAIIEIHVNWQTGLSLRTARIES